MLTNLFHFSFEHAYLVALFAAFAALFFYANKASGPSRLSVPSVVALMNDRKIVLVDIREAKDFKKGHIKGAINYPGSDLEALEMKLKAHETKQQKAVLVCDRGALAMSIGGALKRRGHESVQVLDGGVMAWEEQSLPVSTL